MGTGALVVATTRPAVRPRPTLTSPEASAQPVDPVGPVRHEVVEVPVSRRPLPLTTRTIGRAVPAPSGLPAAALGAAKGHAQLPSVGPVQEGRLGLLTVVPVATSADVPTERGVPRAVATVH